MNELALFAGAGGGILGGSLLGFTTVGAVEIDAYCTSLLLQRQNDGFLPPFPVWDDVCTFDGFPWRGIIDVVSGGFPCQDISAANSKGKGLDGPRSGLWREFARIISEVRPTFALVENSPRLTLRGLDRVLSDLAFLGFDAEWDYFRAADVGAPHQRERIFILAADPDKFNADNSGHESSEILRQRPETSVIQNSVADTKSSGFEAIRRQSKISRFIYSSSPWWDADPADLPDTNLSNEQWRASALQMGREWSKEEDERAFAYGRSEWGVESRVGRVAHGVAARVDRLKATGNGQVSSVVVLAWRVLYARMRGRYENR